MMPILTNWFDQKAYDSGVHIWVNSLVRLGAVPLSYLVHTMVVTFAQGGSMEEVFTEDDYYGFTRHAQLAGLFTQIKPSNDEYPAWVFGHVPDPVPTPATELTGDTTGVVAHQLGANNSAYWLFKWSAALWAWEKHVQGEVVGDQVTFITPLVVGDRVRCMSESADFFSFPSEELTIA
jgi:hypothetical protein